MAKIRFDALPKTLQDRLTEFRDDFISVFSAGIPYVWAEDVANVIETDAPKVRLTLSLDAAGYQEFKDEYNYRELDGRELSLVKKLWNDGVKAKADQLKQSDYLGFAQQPRVLAEYALRLPNKWCAAVLEANPLLEMYRKPDTGAASTINLFHASHPVNIFKSSLGTFGNTGTANLVGVGGFTLANVTLWAKHFASILSPSGDSMGLQLTHVGVPRNRMVEANAFFANDLVVQAIRNAANTDNVGGVMVRNNYNGSVTPVVMDELTNVNDVYPMSLTKAASGLLPLGVIIGATPETNILDENSAMYETTRHVAVNAVVEGYAGAMFPHPIAKVTLS